VLAAIQISPMPRLPADAYVAQLGSFAPRKVANSEQQPKEVPTLFALKYWSVNLALVIMQARFRLIKKPNIDFGVYCVILYFYFEESFGFVIKSLWVNFYFALSLINLLGLRKSITFTRKAFWPTLYITNIFIRKEQLWESFKFHQNLVQQKS